MKRLAILSTHPIQYNAPLFRLLANNAELEVKVFFSKVTDDVRFDPDFGQEVTWDIPLTEGYNHESHPASTKVGLASLIEAISGFQPKAILVYGWNFPGHFAVMRHFHGKKKVWFRGDSTLIDPLPFWKKWIRQLWLTWVYRHVDTAFYVGQANKRYFLWAGLDEDQLIYAPHAVDNDFFMKDDESRHQQALEIRRSLGIPDDAFVFLFVGKLEPKKQPLELASAFRQLLLSEPNVNGHILFVGAGILFEQLALENRDCPQVHLAGFVNQSQMPIYYRVGNCLCLPSRGPGETWGLAVNEAMACGCNAIVSNRVGCGEDLIRLGQNGIIFAANDPEDLKRALSLSISLSPYQEINSLLQRHSYLTFITCLIDHLELPTQQP